MNQPDQPKVNPDNNRDLWFGIILAVLLLVAYQPAWRGTPIFDDAMRIPKPAERSLSGLARVWTHPSADHQYHPLVDTVFWIETRLFQQRMLPYHWTNILLHASAAFLLLKILRYLFIPGTWLATALFALHPLQVESVAYLAELKNILSAVFLFAAVLVYLRYDRDKDRKWYWFTWLLFVIGLFAKASTAYLPVVVLLIEWWKRGNIKWRRDIRPLLPFVVVGIASVVATIWFERRIGAEFGTVMTPPIDRMLIAGRAFWFYLAKVFWPTNLKMFYPRWDVDAGTWWQYVFLLAAISLLLGGWLVRRRYRWLWASLLFFVLTLVPFLGFFSVRMFRFQFVSEHLEYLPLIGIVVPLSAGASMAIARWHGWQQNIARGAVATLLVILTIQTWQHSAAFRNAETCYRDSLAHGGENWLVHENLGIILIARGQFSEAEDNLRKALQLNPSEVASVAGIHLDLGQALRHQGKLTEATEEARKSTDLWPDFRAYDVLASLLHQRGNLREAIANYRKAMELEPKSSVAFANAAWILASAADDSLRNGPEALGLSLKADKLSGGIDPFTLHALAAAYAETGNYPKAIQTARRALGFAEKRLPDLAAQLRSEIALYEINLPARERMH